MLSFYYKDVAGLWILIPHSIGSMGGSAGDRRTSDCLVAKHVMISLIEFPRFIYDAWRSGFTSGAASMNMGSFLFIQYPDNSLNMITAARRGPKPGK